MTTATMTAPAAVKTDHRREPKRRQRRQVSRWARPVQPVKAIWDAASDEERAKARALTTEILGYWLGYQSKAELARQLEVPPIRVWQMSQRAMAGMVAAMLRPPSGRRGRMASVGPEVKELRRRIAQLEKENETQRRLIAVLRTIPGNEKRGLPKEERGAKRRTHRAKKPDKPGGPGPDRSVAPRGT